MTFRTNTMKYSIGDRVRWSNGFIYNGVIAGYVHWPTISDYSLGKPCSYIVVMDDDIEVEVFEDAISEVLNVSG